MAQPDQVSHLFLYVNSQLSSEVINEIDMQEIKNWTELKTKLKTYYNFFKNLAQLYEELETIKKIKTKLTDFYKRLEKLKNECIATENSGCEKPDELASLKKAIQRTALRRFILHVNPKFHKCWEHVILPL